MHARRFHAVACWRLSGRQAALRWQAVSTARGRNEVCQVSPPTAIPRFRQASVPERVGNVNGLTVHMLEAGYETSGRPADPAAAWLSRARLQLAQGDAAAGIGGVSRDRSRPARLRTHDGLGQLL